MRKAEGSQARQGRLGEGKECWVRARAAGQGQEWLGEGKDGQVRARVARPGKQCESSQARVDHGCVRAVWVSG